MRVFPNLSLVCQESLGLSTHWLNRGMTDTINAGLENSVWLKYTLNQLSFLGGLDMDHHNFNSKNGEIVKLLGSTISP